MPTIALIDGIKIQIFYDDHAPPHFHATSGGDEVVIGISNLEIIQGSLPVAKLRRVLQWAGEHQADLALNWILCQDGQSPQRIV